MLFLFKIGVWTTYYNALLQEFKDSAVAAIAKHAIELVVCALPVSDLGLVQLKNLTSAITTWQP